MSAFDELWTFVEKTAAHRPNSQSAQGAPAFAGAAAFAGDTADDDRPARVRILRPEELDLPPVKDLDLPGVEDELVPIEGRKPPLMKYSQVLSSKYYIDNNIKSLKVPIENAFDLTVHKMELTYTHGGTISVPLKWVKFTSDARANRFVQKDDFIIPVDDARKVMFDTNNTPNIVLCVRWVREQLLRISEDRLKIAELVSTFAGAIAGLGQAAAGAPQVPAGGRSTPTRSTGPASGRGRDAAGGSGSTGGKRNPSGGQDAPRVSMTLPEDKGTKAGKTGGGKSNMTNPDGTAKTTSGKSSDKPSTSSGATDGGGSGKATGESGGRAGSGSASRGNRIAEVKRKIDDIIEVEADVAQRGRELVEKRNPPGSMQGASRDTVRQRVRGLAEGGDAEAQKIHKEWTDLENERKGLEKELKGIHKEK